VRFPHWHWPPGVPPSSSVVPVVIVVALLVGTWALRHHALLRLFHQTEPRRQAAPDRPAPTSNSTSASAETVLFLPAQAATPTTSRHSHANKSPQRV
jgi:hypothetical protein